MILEISFRSGEGIVFHGAPARQLFWCDRLHERHLESNKRASSVRAQVLHRGSFFLPACRCVAKWLQDIGLFCTAGRNLRSVNESRTDTSSLCLMESNGSSQHLLSIFYVTAESQVVGPSPEWNLVLDCNLSSGEPGCVFIRVGGGLHIYCIIVAPEGDPRPLQACPPSCFISVCSYMDIFLPSARLHYVRFLNNTQPPPPLHTLFLQISFPLPTITHIHTHSYSCWLAMGRGGSVSSSVQEAMWLILI